MDEDYLYQQIAESVRQEILEGIRKPGEKLPTVRKMTEFWHCTPGTVQRAYKILSQQGLVVSRPGQGTHVSDHPVTSELKPLRRAALVNKSEAFLLESLSAGYSQAEIEMALQMALDRWRILQSEPAITGEETIRFAGSNDLVITWLASHFDSILPGMNLQLQFGGSLSGLIALAENRADIAGCHLWDEEDQDYNRSYVERILPGRKTALITLANRQIGLIVPAGNPQNVFGLKDLTQKNVFFANRQSGSGTRVWFDGRLRDLHIRTDAIQGYENEKSTHGEVARSITEGTATAGLGLQAAADAYSLGFVPLTRERYELAILEETMKSSNLMKFISWLASAEAKEAISSLSGYDSLHSGSIRWIN